MQQNFWVCIPARSGSGRIRACCPRTAHLVVTAGTAEMKRLYVRPAHRGEGLGRALAETAIAVARHAGCTRIVLDTLPKMVEARALYRALGFRPIDPYLESPTPGALCFGLSLSGSAARAR